MCLSHETSRRCLSSTTPSSRRPITSCVGQARTDHNRFPISDIEVVHHHHDCDPKKLPLHPRVALVVSTMTSTTFTDSASSTIATKPQNAVPDASAQTEAKKIKKVSFNRDVVMRYHTHLNDMTRSEIESSFVSNNEFRQARYECDTLRRLLDEQESVVLLNRDQEGSSSSRSSSSNSVDYDRLIEFESVIHRHYRGIRTTSRCHLVTAARRRAVKEVLKAQEQSWHQYHHNNEQHSSDGNNSKDLHDCYNESAHEIARSYRRVVRLCRSEVAARQIGLQDQTEASLSVGATAS
mmetsp:Transcript_60/g.63  ORF Transcript_60/g.63 Transcript_60/m.63 type:complete len:294 (-) Transcript_60:407-1288(-)